MRNFYYVTTYNLSHPAVRAMLDRMNLITLHDSLTDLKVRSKHFIGYQEATAHVSEDFDKKLASIFPAGEGEKREENIKIITVMNPKFALPDEMLAQIAERFGEQHNTWDDDCCGTIFFCDTPEDEEDDFPQSWMMKYEIHFADDNIKLLHKNGEYAFAPSSLPTGSYTSSLH